MFIMNDFQQINEIVDNSIRNSSYISVLISSCVFIAYMLIIKVVDYFKSKEKNKPFLEMAKAIKDVSDNVVKLNNVLDKTFQNAEKKELAKAKEVIALAFNSLQNKINGECIDMIIHNHIEENKQYILENINKLVNTEYYKIYATLSAYDVNGSNISSKLEKEWIDELITSITNIMFNGQDSNIRISQLNSRLAVDINNYSTYTYNKVFNN